jgi:ABC-2 type transport system permease protein
MIGSSFWRCARAEWIKLRTMRSTGYLIVGIVAFCAALTALNATSVGVDYAGMSPADRAEFDPLAISLRGYLLAQIALGMLGGLAITAEYGSRTISGTLAAVPGRGRVLAAKATVLTLVAVPVGLVVSVISFVVGQASLAAKDAPHLSLTDGLALRGIAGSSAYLALATLFGLAIGTILRSTTATVTTLFGALLIVQAFAPALPGGFGDWMMKYWPSVAGGQIITGYRDPDLLGPWSGLAVLAACVCALMAAAFVVFRERDA